MAQKDSPGLRTKKAHAFGLASLTTEPHPAHFGAVACKRCKREQATVRVRVGPKGRSLGAWCAACLPAVLRALATKHRPERGI